MLRRTMMSVSWRLWSPDALRNRTRCSRGGNWRRNRLAPTSSAGCAAISKPDTARRRFSIRFGDAARLFLSQSVPDRQGALRFQDGRALALCGSSRRRVFREPDCSLRRRAAIRCPAPRPVNGHASTRAASRQGSSRSAQSPACDQTTSQRGRVPLGVGSCAFEHFNLCWPAAGSAAGARFRALSADNLATLAAPRVLKNGSPARTIPPCRTTRRLRRAPFFASIR